MNRAGAEPQRPRLHFWMALGKLFRPVGPSISCVVKEQGSSWELCLDAATS